MKILCCLNADIVSNAALNLLLPSLADHEVTVGLSTRIGGRSEEHTSELQSQRDISYAWSMYSKIC